MSRARVTKIQRIMLGASVVGLLSEESRPYKEHTGGHQRKVNVWVTQETQSRLDSDVTRLHNVLMTGREGSSYL